METAPESDFIKVLSALRASYGYSAIATTEYCSVDSIKKLIESYPTKEELLKKYENALMGIAFRLISRSEPPSKAELMVGIKKLEGFKISGLTETDCAKLRNEYLDWIRTFL